MIRKIASWFIGYKKKYENSALILVGLSMIVFIIIIVSSLTSILPKTWRFDPDAYGTVSDWVMVIVTLITAVFLYQTLRSQMTVQRDQEKINLLTAYDIRNRYKAEIELTNPQEQPGTISDISRWTFEVKNNDALNILITTNAEHTVNSYGSSTTQKDKFFSSYISMVNANDSFSLTLIDKERFEYIDQKANDSENKFHDWISFDVMYKDNFKFTYIKRFVISFNPFSNQLNVTQTNTEFL